MLIGPSLERGPIGCSVPSAVVLRPVLRIVVSALKVVAEKIIIF